MVSAEICPGVLFPLAPIGYESLSVGATAVGLTIPARAEQAYGVLEDNAVRYRDDGTDPTADEGLLLPTGSVVVICSPSLGRIKFISDTGAAGILKVAYYGR